MQVFAYSGTELVGLAAAETRNPRKSLPKAAKQVLWRVALFYIVNLLIVGLNVPYTDPRLLGSGTAASAGVDAAASPFVLAIQNAGIKVLPSIINAVVLISSLSVANSCTYASTRTVQALAMSGDAPRFLAYVDKQGRPLGPVIIQILFGFLAYIQLASTGLTVFNWLLSIGSLSATLMYWSINFAHFRFRRTFKVQGRSMEDVPWISPLGIYGSILGVFLASICLVAVFYSSLYVSPCYLNRISLFVAAKDSRDRMNSNFLNTSPPATLLQPLTISSKAISPPLSSCSSSLYSNAIVANGGLELVSMRSILTRANAL